MKMNKLLWLLFGVFLLFGVSECSSSKNNNDDDKREVNPSGLGGSILPEVPPTAPTAETQAPLVEETKTEADAVGTLDMDPASSKKANRGQPSRQYEHMGCFKLFSFERPSAAMLPSEADMTPAVCIEACRREKAVLTLMMLGDVCMAVPQTEVDRFLGRETGVCESPCSGDPDSTCGGQGAFDLFRLHYGAEGGSEDDPVLPSTDEAVQKDGSGATAGTSADPGERTTHFVDTGDDAAAGTAAAAAAPLATDASGDVERDDAATLSSAATRDHKSETASSPSLSATAGVDCNQAVIQSELRFTRKLMRDKNVHVSVIPGTDVAPPSLVFHKTGLASVEGVKATKVIPLIGETTVRASAEKTSRVRFTIEVRKKRYEMQAPGMEARDAWIAAIRAVLNDATRTESDDEDDNAGAEDVSRNKDTAAGDATFDDGARGDILQEVSTTAPTTDGEASSIGGNVERDDAATPPSAAIRDHKSETASSSSLSATAGVDRNQAVIQSELRFTRKLMRDKNVHVSVIPGTDVATPSLVFHKTGLASVEGAKATKVIPLIGETTVRASAEKNSRKRFTVEIRKKTFEFQALDKEARDAWIAAIRAVLNDAARTKSDGEDDKAGAEDASRNKDTAAGDATFDDRAPAQRATILPEASTTGQTTDGEASSIDEADDRITDNNFGSTREESNVDSFSGSEFIACLELRQTEMSSVAKLVPEEALTPPSCMAWCRSNNAVAAIMVRGDACLCLDDQRDIDRFLHGRETGVCGAPCTGDATAMCGGETSYSLHKLSGVEDGRDNLSQPVGNDPGSAKEADEVRSSLYEYTDCLRLQPSERTFPSTLPPLAMMTPSVCISACQRKEALFAVMLRGDICVCSPYDVFAEHFFRGRKTGVCKSPCDGDPTLMCGGEDSYHLVKLHRDEASKDKRSHPFDVMYDTKRAIFKSELRFGRDPRRDKIFHVSLIPRFFTWPPFLVLHEAGLASVEGARVKKVIPLTSKTGVRATYCLSSAYITSSCNVFRVYNLKDAYDFEAPYPEIRDTWIKAIEVAVLDATPPTKSDGEDDDGSVPRYVSDDEDHPHDEDLAAGGTASDDSPPRKGTVHVKEGIFEWGKRELSLVHGVKLQLCKIEREKVTDACEVRSLDARSAIVSLPVVEGDKRKDVRHPFRVTTSEPWAKFDRMWILDTGSKEETEAWVSLLKGVVAQSTPDGKDPMADPRKPRDAPDRDYEDTFRGRKLFPGQYPLQVGNFLSTFPITPYANLEIRANGDVILGRGAMPFLSEDKDPIWVHRSVGGYANGGLGCVLQSFWNSLGITKWVDLRVNLRVKNGRWRVGRGALCTMGQSPRPAGSWRRFLPWDARGQAIKKAWLELRDETFVIVSGEEVLWSSSPSPQGGTGGVAEERATTGLETPRTYDIMEYALD